MEHWHAPVWTFHSAFLVLSYAQSQWIRNNDDTVFFCQLVVDAVHGRLASMRFGRSEVMKTSSQPTAPNQWFNSQRRTAVSCVEKRQWSVVCTERASMVSQTSIGTLSNSTLTFDKFTPILRDGMERIKSFSFPGLMDTS